jgi:hypothetical protein
MTVKEAVISELGFTPGNTNTIDKAIADNGLTGTVAYSSSSHNTSVLKSVLQVCRLLYSTPDVTTSNAGIVTSSIKYDRAYLKERIKQLEDELGLTPASTIARDITRIR